VIRLATLDDLAAVLALAGALWPDQPAEEHLRAVLAGRPRSTLPLVVFLAFDGDVAICFVEVGLRSHADGCDDARPVGFLEGWYVAPSHRRAGVGGALVAAAEAWARGQGCVEMASDTWLDADLSRQAHVALGYEVVDRCVHFRKALTPAPAAAVRLRDLVPADLPALLALNNAHAAEVNELNLAALARMVEVAAQVRVVDGCLGFLLAFDQRTPAQGPNHAWFLARESSFVYVDRVVIAAAARRRGLARALYDELPRDRPCCCEVHVDNAASLAFHARLGFVPCGEAVDPRDGKRVRFLRRSAP
jgi:predicted GNAT superfamily acetyltransferase